MVYLRPRQHCTRNGRACRSLCMSTCLSACLFVRVFSPLSCCSQLQHHLSHLPSSRSVTTTGVINILPQFTLCKLSSKSAQRRRVHAAWASAELLSAGHSPAPRSEQSAVAAERQRRRLTGDILRLLCIRGMRNTLHLLRRCHALPSARAQYTAWRVETRKLLKSRTHRDFVKESLDRLKYLYCKSSQ